MSKRASRRAKDTPNARQAAFDSLDYARVGSMKWMTKQEVEALERDEGVSFFVSLTCPVRP